MDETVYAHWRVNKDQAVFKSLIILILISGIFLFSFISIFFVDRSTNIILLIIPIVLFIILLAILPEVLKTWSSFKENTEVYITEKGVYKKPLSSSQNYVFLPWEQMNGYDMKYFISSSPLGGFFPKPIRFIIKTSDQNKLELDSLGENTDILRAYLKENNIPFGFLQK